MKGKVIGKEQLAGWLDNLREEYDVWAPVKGNGLVSFHPINSASEIYFGFLNTRKTPKDLFFPQSEVLFSFRRGEMEKDRDTLLEKPRIIFAIRPCDAQNLALLDKVFDSEDYQDPYYVERRKGTLLFGMACTHPQTTCFCTSMRAGPFEKTCLDLLIVDLGNDRYFVEAVTEQGKDAIGKNNLLEDAREKDTERLAKTKKEAEEKIKSKIVIEGLEEKLDKIFDSSLWDRVHQRCLGCAICTYLCSTCHCFALLDEKVDSGGQRIRSWDSCMFPGFTLEASGHNPRISNKERMRQRVMHKFNYFVKNFGQTACVGCGRCIRNCPVNIDIREIIQEIDDE